MTAIVDGSRAERAGGASQHSSPDRLEELGIVGAGGGGFPAAAKFRTKVSTVIANAAECEPLLHKDKELLHHYAEPFLRGLQMAMEMVGAGEGVVGIKEKYHDIIAALESAAPASIRVVPLPDCYPAGDEFILVHLVTGRVIPPGGLPKDVDTVVSNVETLINIALDLPVTHKYLTVAGAVANPVTLRVPVGITNGASTFNPVTGPWSYVNSAGNVNWSSSLYFVETRKPTSTVTDCPGARLGTGTCNTSPTIQPPEGSWYW